jgi:hypothetical protein
VQLAPLEQELQDAIQELRELKEDNKQLKSTVVQQAAKLARAMNCEAAANLNYENVVKEREELTASVRCAPYFSHDGDPKFKCTHSLFPSYLLVQELCDVAVL